MMEKDIISKNPVMILFLGACPALAATTTATASVGMAVSVCLILVLSSVLMSLMRKGVGDAIRLPLAIVISAGFASIAQMVMAAYLPKVYAMLGVYLAIVAVNAMVVTHQQNTASQEGFGASLKQAVITGIEFCALVIVMGIVREILGNGTCFGAKVPFFANHTIAVFGKAGGAFIVFAILLAVAGCFRKEAK